MVPVEKIVGVTSMEQIDLGERTGSVTLTANSGIVWGISKEQKQRYVTLQESQTGFQESAQFKYCWK